MIPLLVQAIKKKYKNMNIKMSWLKYHLMTDPMKMIKISMILKIIGKLKRLILMKNNNNIIIFAMVNLLN